MDTSMTKSASNGNRKANGNGHGNGHGNGNVDATEHTQSQSQSHSTTSSKQSSTNTSLTTSPQISRDSSPIRPPPRSGSGLSKSSLPGPRSRKNSYQEQSPSRPSRSTVPSSAAIQRSLSSNTTPTLLPAVQDPNQGLKQPQKSPLPVEQLRDTQAPRWPVSPRLRSPPPALGRPNIGGSLDTPTINLQRASPSPQLEAQTLVSDSETEEIQLHSGMRTPARSTTGAPGPSTLETVQEVSLPNSPRHGIASALDKVTESLLSEAAARGEQLEVTATRTAKTRPSLAATPNESGSDNGAGSSSRRSTSVAQPPLLSRQSSSNTVKLASRKGKGTEAMMQQMTVETETVTSVPHVSLAPSGGPQGSQASLRTKPSTETIRPKKEKKEKKKTTRRQAAVPAGASSSKADVFEANIVSAIDETGDSDSEETFVYDSNPPDTDRRRGRFHSRTPSATSVMSQADRAGMRSITTVMDNTAPGPSMTMKKGMKFVNTYTSNATDTSGADDEGRGTNRSTTGPMRGTTRNHHVNNWRRNNGNGHTSLFDSQGPFPNVARQKLNSGGTASRNSSSGPPSPRHDRRENTRPLRGKRSMQVANDIDLDEASRADDERTPLLNATIRSNASRRANGNGNGPRRQGVRHLESQTFAHTPSFLTRFASCLVLTVMILLVVTGAIGFMFATSQPLSQVDLRAITNVVASEQELMLDMTVRAYNPNVVVIQIESADIEVFAKSIHAGTDSEWWKYPHGAPESGQGDVEKMDDPASDLPPDDKAPNMRLGAILEFDSPLSFEGSFFHPGFTTSTGSARLSRPGNSTAGGSERWERILQDEFDLILKGVVKYSLPLSQRIRSVSITGRTTVKPNPASDPKPPPPPPKEPLPPKEPPSNPPNGTKFSANV